MNRGDRREAIFEDDEDRERLLQTLTQACQKTGWQVHAYCLMRNHFHLVLEKGAGALAGRSFAKSCWSGWTRGLDRAKDAILGSK